MDDRQLNPLASNLPNASIIGGTQKKEERPPLEPVVSTPAVLRKKPWYQRAGETIFSEDTNTIGGYILKDVIIPAIRDTLYDIVTGGLSMALYSTPKAGRGGKRPSNSGYVSYGSYYAGNDKTKPKPIERADKYRTQLDIYNITLPSDFPDNPADKSAANIGYAALEQLGDRIDIYGVATVQDLYDTLRIGSAPSTMSNWGWNDISTAKVEFDRGEWVLRMPKVIPLR